jgi:hypothetical protein
MPKDDSDRQALAAAKDGNITTGLNRLNALFTWWGVSNSYRNGDIDTPMKRLQACASDLQKSYGDAYGVIIRPGPQMNRFSTPGVGADRGYLYRF